jgi:hypothetical protein
LPRVGGGGQRANFPHGAVCRVRLITESPLTQLGPRYSGDAAIPERERQEDALVPPRDRTRFVIRLIEPVCPRKSSERRGTFTGQCCCHCEQVTPPNTSRAGGNSRDAFLRRPFEGPHTSARLGAWHHRAAGLRPLPLYPCLAPSSPLVAKRRWLRRSSCWRFRARTSGRTRIRPGRIKPPWWEDCTV